MSQPPKRVESLPWPVEREDPDVGYDHDEGEDPVLARWIRELRRRHRPDTWTAMMYPLSPELWPTSFGPHGDEVRRLP